MIKNLAGNASVLVTTHILQDVPELADRVIVLAGGTIRFDGTVGDFAAHADQSSPATQELESAYQAIVSEQAVAE